MTVKFVTLDLKSMLLQGDIIAVSWKKNKYVGGESNLTQWYCIERSGLGNDRADEQ